MAKQEKLVTVKFKKTVMMYGQIRKAKSTLDGVSVHDANLLKHNEQADIVEPAPAKGEKD